LKTVSEDAGVGIVVYQAFLQALAAFRLAEAELEALSLLELAEEAELPPPPPPQAVIKIDRKTKNPIDLIFINTPYI
jgi:hypothetical protein